MVRGIFSELLFYLNVDTTYSEEDKWMMDTFVPIAEGHSVEEAKKDLEDKGFTVRIIGDGEKVVSQIPAGGKTAPKSCTVVLNTDSNDEVPKTTVPDLVGLSPSKVAYAVKNKNLNIRYSGTGYDSTSGLSVSQDIPAGSVVEEGTVVTVDFTVDGIND